MDLQALLGEALATPLGASIGNPSEMETTNALHDAIRSETDRRSLIPFQQAAILTAQFARVDLDHFLQEAAASSSSFFLKTANLLVIHARSVI